MQTSLFAVSGNLPGPKINASTLERIYASLQVGNALQDLTNRINDAPESNGCLCSIPEGHRSIVH